MCPAELTPKEGDTAASPVTGGLHFFWLQGGSFSPVDHRCCQNTIITSQS